MRVRQVSLTETIAAKEAGCPALTPELMAAVGARYSRNNEGLDTILEKVDRMNPDKAVDAIFKFIDYGHSSVADMAPVAMFMDDISIFAAYYLWSISPLAGGQESSTRYIKISKEGLIDPDTLGIPKEDQKDWEERMLQGFHMYDEALAAWEKIGEEHPELMRIPKSLLQSTDDADVKKVARMKRNFAFDRARYYIPVAAATNVMMVQSARAWAALSSHLQSSLYPELRQLGAMIASEMELVVPRLVRHTKPQDSSVRVIEDEFLDWSELAWRIAHKDCEPCEHRDAARIEVYPPRDTHVGPVSVSRLDRLDRFRNALKHRENRYSLVGSELSRTAVRFWWEAVSIAEIRDLNRHRTGTKWCPLVPLGFYGALDQLPEEVYGSALEKFARWGNNQAKLALEMLANEREEYIYYTYLGTQYQFEHTTTADKFIYEMELRTGVGAHYRYAKHCHDMLEQFYAAVPGTKGLIMEGSAEPE